VLGLLRKEWRENRLLIFGLLAAAPALSGLVKSLGLGREGLGDLSFATYGIPSMLGLYLVAVSADLIANDSGAERHGFVAALPVRAGTVWSAKALFLFGSTALYLGYLVLTETAIVAIVTGSVSTISESPARRYAVLLWVLPLGGAATLFWSTLIDRGLTAAFAALFTLAGIGVFILLYDVKRFRLVHGTENTVVLAALVLTAGFLAGSYLAFAFGRIHLGCRVRRTVLAMAALLLIVVPTAADAAIRLERWMMITPGDPGLVTRKLATEPAGDWVFSLVYRDSVGPLGADGGFYGPHALFATHGTDGRVRNLTRYGHPLSASRENDAPGRVRLYRREMVPGESVQITLITDYDLETGEPVTTRPWNREQHGDPDRRPSR